MVALDLKTSRLHLRPVRPEDARITAALMDEEIASYLTTWPSNLSPKQAAARIAAAEEGHSAREAIEFAIIRRTTDRLIGWLSFMLECPKSGVATIGFWLAREQHGQGFMTEAATIAMPVAADFLRARTIEAYIYPWNSASIRLVRKLGFHVDGGAALYSPVRSRNEEAFLYRLDLAERKFAPMIAIPLEQ